MAPIRAVYDTNVLVSAFIGKGAPYRALKVVYKGKVTLIMSPEMLIEFEGVISREKFHYSEEHVRNIISVIVKAAELIYPQVRVDAVKDDPSDNKVIEAAMAGHAGFIVTGDAHLLDLKEYRNIKIITAHEFLNRL